MPPAKTFDIDALLKDALAEASSKVTYIKVKLFDREWRISSQINTFLALRAGEGDTKAFTEFLMNVAHPDERADFQEALYRIEPLTADILLLIINNLMEAVAGNPTKPSSASSRSGKTSAAKPKSAGA